MYCTHSQLQSSLLRKLSCIGLVPTLLLLMGCGTQPEIDMDVDETEAVYFETIGQGASSLFTDTTQVVIKSEVMWNEYEQYMKTVLPFPEIDFSQLMVVVVAVPVPMRGVTIQIQSAELADDEMVVNYLMAFPGDDCRGNDQPSSPFQVVMMPHKEIPVRFEHEFEEYPCTLG